MHSEFRIGRRLVQPELNTILHSGKATRVEPKVMEVLVYLARRPGEVVGRETLIRDLWGDTFVTDAALTRCIAELRKVFDDDVREPRVIQTIAKSGYRLIALVEPATKDEDEELARASTTVEGEKPASQSHALSRLLLPTLFVAVGLIAGATVMFIALRPVARQPQQVLRSSLTLVGESLAIGTSRAMAVSPDGFRVAYVGGQSSNRKLFLRVLDSSVVTPIPESDGARTPFFSPDSRWLGFWSDGKLKKVLLSNLSIVSICDTLGTSGASWGTNGTIVGRSLPRV
jgi:DNA-binding winged helix-turn-helix (wHTH) protein